MSLFFILNNLHFSLEILGALAFLVVVWLAYDAFKIRKDFLTVSRGVGFLFLAIAQLIHALNFSSDLWGYSGYISNILGLGFVVWNLWLEAPVSRPEFKAILILPGLSSLLVPFNVIAALGNFTVSYLAYRQYKRELKKTLMPFWIGFSFFTLGAGLAVFYERDAFNVLWAVGHIAEFVGFLFVGWWVWHYLQLRIREEMLLIFVSITMFMAVLVSLTFSTILINRQEAQTSVNLSVNVKVLDYAISRLKEESLAKAKLIAGNEELKAAMASDNFPAIEELLNNIIVEEKLGLVTLVDSEGYAVMRAHAPSQREDLLSGQSSVSSALAGKAVVTIEKDSVDGFAVRAASPIFAESGGNIVGAVAAGFQLDNALADNIRRITGLEMSIYDGDTRVGTTALNPDGKTRSAGIKETNSVILEGVLKNGNDVTLRTAILSRPFLASFLPLKNSENKVVGMISAAKSQEEILKTAQATSRFTLVIVAIIMLIMVLPIYAITRRLSEEFSGA